MTRGRDDAKSVLRAAWDDLLAELARARDAIDRPALMPPPPGDRNLAEGYRYLLGFVHGGIERAFFSDPARPAFRHVLQILNKGTIDNADAIYFAAPIDGRHAYVLRGSVGDARHWCGEAPASAGRLAPRYLIFELSDGPLAGDTGNLAELRPGVKVQTGRIDSSALEVDPDGRFEILLAPERPPDHTGSFVSTHRRVSRPPPDDPEGSLDRYAAWISGRQLFHDWEREDPAFLTVTRVDPPADPPPPYDPASAARELRALGAMVRGQMHFWNRFYTELLETYGKRGGAEGERFMPRNKFNAVNAASRETGGGQSTNLYAGGVFELEPDEALLIESRVKVEPQYLGIVLANLWGESLDFANHPCSLNGFQSERDPDGALRWVIAHRDPGIPNWLDTTGHREGFISPRWTYSTPPPQTSWPTICATKVPFDRIREHLPEGTRRVDPDERLARIRVRQEHVLRRYRAF